MLERYLAATAQTAKASQQDLVPSSDQVLPPPESTIYEPFNQTTIIPQSTLVASRQPIPGDLKQRQLSGGYFQYKGLYIIRVICCHIASTAPKSY